MKTQQAVEKTKERIEGLIKTVVEDLHLSDNDWVKKYGEVPYWEVLSLKLLSLIDEERRGAYLEGIDEAIKNAKCNQEALVTNHLEEK